MKRVILVTILFTMTLSACGLGGSTESEPAATPLATVEPGEAQATEPPPETDFAEASEKPCGDGVCDGPETADLCPEGCATPGPESEPEPPREATSGPIPLVYAFEPNVLKEL